MIKNYSVIALALSTVLLSTASAQTVAPIRSPLPQATQPIPFDYPVGFTQPTFDREEHIGQNVNFGDFEVTLGVTKLSAVTKTLGGSLQFNDARTGFVCYSAEAPKPAVTGKKKAKSKESEEVEETVPDGNYQNVWLIVGSKGEISEARALRISDSDKKCPVLSDEFKRVRIGSIYINEPVKNLAEPSVIVAESEWKFWFSKKPGDGKDSQVGFLGVQDNDGFVTRIISVIETIKGL